MPIELLPETPSQTAGPYVHIGLALEAAGNPTRDQEIWNRMARSDAPGEHIVLIGHVYDGNGHLVRDSFLEFWQADAAGRYAEGNTGFIGFGRVTHPDKHPVIFGHHGVSTDTGFWGHLVRSRNFGAKPLGVELKAVITTADAVTFAATS